MINILKLNLAPATPPGSAQTLWRCYGYLRPYWILTLGAYLATFGTTAINVLTPQFIRLTIDRGIREQATHLLAAMVIGLLVLTLLRGVFTFLQGRWSETMAQSVAYDLRHALQRQVTTLSFAFRDQTETGELLSRAMQDVERIRMVTGRATIRIVNSAILFLATAVALVWMNPSLALFVILTLPLLIWRAIDFGTRARPIAQAIQKQLAILTTRLEQNLRGARVVKSFAQEDAEIERFTRENEQWYGYTAQNARLEAINAPLMHLIANLGTVVIVWYGGWLVINQQLTLGELVAFTTYLAQLVQPIRLLGNTIPMLATGSAAGERIFEILDQAPQVRDAPDARDLPPLRGAVCFENVSFSYSQRNAVLKDISFETKPGQVIALLGTTGSGKSTLINLIPRFYDPTAGRVLIDERDIRDVTLNSLRSQIGIVLQETTLFARTIRENIAFGCPDATQAQIEAVAQMAHAHAFIAQMPNGYATDVGERGVTLSGGQKQRLAIARALLINPRILILDDATSSVDTGTEKLIQRALDALMRGRTTFVIAHRLSTLQNADQILVLDQGKIVARGAHAELITRSRLYAEIYRRQVVPQA
ncbi:MAG: ABC transporter ATP-binding protein [Chloroflexi bacterium]|nr:ABC transporter ATP-binding protein [Chloroflexota bacterium]